MHLLSELMGEYDDDTTQRDLALDDTAVMVVAPRRARTQSEWPPPAPRPSQPSFRRARFLPAITESKLR